MANFVLQRLRLLFL